MKFGDFISEKCWP